jgi:hypothetical protein
MPKTIHLPLKTKKLCDRLKVIRQLTFASQAAQGGCIGATQFAVESFVQSQGPKRPVLAPRTKTRLLIPHRHSIPAYFLFKAELTVYLLAQVLLDL